MAYEGFEIIAAHASQAIGDTGRLIDTMEVDAVSLPNRVPIAVTIPKGPGWADAAKEACAAEAREAESLFA